ncbi:MAG: ABC transporter ATP-binding protein [Candidatus Hydrogenedentes bacterium]|nr:ABC transporter ATP-binding protein [Candidatus Hydrogenedentota bacterium]
MDAIATQDLGKTYRSSLLRALPPSLDGLSLAVQENEVFGFLGRNGAGKTTTIKILSGLVRQTHGEAYIFGDSVRKRQARRHIGYLPENPYFYEYLTPRETLDFYGRLHGLGTRERTAEWDKLSDLLDLRDIASQRVREFSKGMRQRLGFAVALVGDPKVLILDEPMSGLDPLGRRSIRELILRMRDEKKTIFFSSHVLGDVEQICDRVGILVKGKLTSQGRIDELLGKQDSPVEVIVTGLAADVVAELESKALSTRVSEAGHHLTLQDVQTANEAVRVALAKGGSLVEFTQLKESLEDHFVKAQEVSP